MQAVRDDEMETIHLYIVKEQPKQPYTALPLFLAFLCLAGIVAIVWYSAEHPYYVHKRITVPATFLPLKVFRAEAPIIPTGVKTYPATFSHGFLTLSNGSVISQTLPANFIISANNGFQVATDSAVYVPAGSADGYGMSTVPAHLLTSGINLSTLSINEVIGSSLFIRNLSPFTGGKPAYSVKFVTSNDRNMATSKARTTLALQIRGYHNPCQESYLYKPLQITASWGCRFATFKVPSYMHVTSAKLSGKNFLVDVSFIPLPKTVWLR